MQIEILGIAILISFSALFSGLNLGLLSLDLGDLERETRLGNKKAATVLQVRRHGNLLLTTLLFGNTAVNAGISILLARILSGGIAMMFATGLILILGELIPQAVCSRHPLAIGARAAWLIRIIITIAYPLCAPIAWALDAVLGKELPTFYTKRELTAMVEDYANNAGSGIDADEARIVRGALRFSGKVAADVMTPRTVIFALDVQTILTRKVLERIRQSGVTRIPVYDGQLDKTVGILFAKKLIGIRKCTPVADVFKRTPSVSVREKTKLDALFHLFLSRRPPMHLAVVKNEAGLVSGIVTLEDVLEEIIGQEIVDEADAEVEARRATGEFSTGE